MVSYSVIVGSDSITRLQPNLILCLIVSLSNRSFEASLRGFIDGLGVAFFVSVLGGFPKGER